MSFFAALYFYMPIATLYYQSKGLDFVEINSLWGIILAAKAMAEVPTGILADKMGRKYSLVAAMLLQLIGEVVYIFATNYAMFAVASIIGGIGFAFSSGCFEAMLYDTLKAQDRTAEAQKVLGMNSALANTGFMLSAFIGGIIVSDGATEKFVPLIIMTAACVGIALFVSFFLKEPASAYHHVETSPVVLFRSCVDQIKGNKALHRLVLLSLFATPFANYLCNLYQPYFVKAQVPAFLFGISLSAAALLGILTSKYAYMLEKKLGPRGALLLATALPAILYILLALIAGPLSSFILFVLASASMEFQKPIFSDYINKHIDSGTRATALSVISMVSGIYIWLMGLVIGAIANHSLSNAFIFMAAVIVAGIVFIRVEDKSI